MGQGHSSEKSSEDGEESTERLTQESVQNEGVMPQSELEIKPSIPEKDEGQINKARFAAICNGLHRIARLQRASTVARIDARQKHREASIKRQDVWKSDVRFMDEVQHLMAGEIVAGFGELSKLAVECQRARDGLGPIEQETIEAEQKWEGTVWKLRHAEDNFYAEFKDEFETMGAYASESPISVAYSPYRSDSDSDSNSASGSHDLAEGILEIEPYITYRPAGSAVSASSFPPFSPEVDNTSDFEEEIFPMDEILRGMDEDKLELRQSDEFVRDGDSGIGDIDEILSRSPPPQYALGKSLPLPEGDHINSLTSLLTDFTTVRERIERWLECGVLSSRFEAMTLFGILRSEFEGDIPSNWAQLIIAYWELKGKPDTRHQEVATREIPTREQSGTASTTGKQTYLEPPAIEHGKLSSYAISSSSRGSSQTQPMSLTGSISKPQVLGSPLSSGSPSSPPQFQYGFYGDFPNLEERYKPP